MGDRWRAAGLAARSVLLEGDPITRIVDSVASQDADLVVMCSSGHGRGVISEMVRQVLQRAYCSALIVGEAEPAIAGEGSPVIAGEGEPGAVGEGAPAAAGDAGPTAQLPGPFRYRRILVPLDGSVRAECVLPVVTAIARSQDADLILGHVVSEPEMPRRTPPTAEDLALVRQLTERNRAEAELYLATIRDRLGGKADVRLVTDHSVPASLHRLAEGEQVDLVALCAHGYSGEARWVCGSVATNFIGYGAAPLLLVQDLARPRASQLDPHVMGTRAPLRCSVVE